MEVGGGGDRKKGDTLVRHTHQYKNMCVMAPLWLGGSASEVVELDGFGVIVSEELACPAALCPRCGTVDICPGSCLKDGSLTLMIIASLMVLVKPYDFLPTLEKLSNVMLCPVIWKCLKMGKGNLRYSLYISPKYLLVSPMYSMLKLG